MHRTFRHICQNLIGLLLLFSTGFSASAQAFNPIEQHILDSLNQVILENESDTGVAYAWVSLSEILYVSNPDTVIPLCKQALKVVDQNWTSANKEQQMSFLKTKGAAINNIGYINKRRGLIADALTYYEQSVKIAEQIGDKKGLAASLNNLATIYDDQKEYDKAIEYYKKSLELERSINNKKGIALTLNNLGFVARAKGAVEEGLAYYQASLEIWKDLNYRAGVGDVLNNIGTVYSKKRENQKALEAYRKSLNIRLELNNQMGTAEALNNIGIVHYNMQNYDSALFYSQKSLELSQKIGFPKFIKRAASLSYESYEKLNRYEDALEMHKLYTRMKDSIFNENTERATVKNQIKYKYEKQKALDDKENEKRIAIEKEKQEKQFVILIFTISGASLIAILLLIIYRRLQITRKQKHIIEEQKEEVESQRDQIETQKEVIEEKHGEIQESINYARRIQTAILPPEHMVKSHLPDSFILYLPKDVVAGDFYWLEAHGDEIYFAVADCTGHGVPGAMVSVVCHSALNRCVREYGLKKPSDILDKTRELVITTFEKSEEQMKDGMDISLCVWNRTQRTLQYSGANNALYLIRKESEEVETILANREPIGYTQNPTPFTNHTIDLNDLEEIILFSDGYADQFGGLKGKKFGYKQFRKLLFEIQSQPMPKRPTILKETFDEWVDQGSDLQIDDICIMGIKFK